MEDELGQELAKAIRVVNSLPGWMQKIEYERIDVNSIMDNDKYYLELFHNLFRKVKFNWHPDNYGSGVIEYFNSTGSHYVSLCGGDITKALLTYIIEESLK